MNSVSTKSEQPSHRHDGDARAVVVDPIECVRQSAFGFGSVTRARGQEQATVLRNVDHIAADFGGWRGFFTADRRLGQLGRNRRDRRGGLGSLEGVLASPVDLRSRIGGRRVALTRRRNTGLARRSTPPWPVEYAGATIIRVATAWVIEILCFFFSTHS